MKLNHPKRNVPIKGYSGFEDNVEQSTVPITTP